MKYPIALLLVALFIAACGTQETTTEGELSLQEKQTLLQEKQQQLRNLTQEVEELEQEIAKEDPTQVARTLVTIDTVDLTDFEHFVEIQGSIESDDYANIASEVPGRIIELKIEEGDYVRKNQLVAKVNLEELNKQKAEVETQLDLAKETYERQKRLWEQNIGSEIQYLQAKNTVERLEKTLETLDYQMTKSDIYAPISGEIEELYLKAGEYAAPGTPIARILNVNNVKVVADVPENYLRNIKLGERVTIRVPALDYETTAPITQIGSTVDPSNRTFEVEVNLAGSRNNQLKPNLLAIMFINDYTEENVVTIPVELVQQEVGGKDFVMLSKATDQGAVAEKVYVQMGRSYEGEAVITSGLKGGEIIVVDGARTLSDGQAIRPESAAQFSNAKTAANNG